MLERVTLEGCICAAARHAAVCGHTAYVDEVRAPTTNTKGSNVSNTVHGHEIMRMIDRADPPLTREALQREIDRRFGAGVRFHACADQNMTLANLLEFLRARGKVVEIDGRFSTDLGQMCAHDEPAA